MRIGYLYLYINCLEDIIYLCIYHCTLTSLLCNKDSIHSCGRKQRKNRGMERRKDSRDRMEDDCVKDGSEAHHKVDMWLMTLFPSSLTARFSWKCSFLIPFMLGIPTHRPFSWMPSRPPRAFIFLLEIFATIYSITFFVLVICFSSYDKLLLNL